MSKRNLSGTAQETAYTTLVRPKLQYACTAWDPHYQKDKAALERVQRKSARFFTGNYDRATLLTGIYTLETVPRRNTRLSVIYKMCYGFLESDGKWKDYLIEKGGHEEATILSLLYRKDTRIFLDFLSFPGQ